MHFLERWVDQIKREGFKEEYQSYICTEKCARLHRLLCVPIKDVRLKMERRKISFEEKQKQRMAVITTIRCLTWLKPIY